MACYAALAPLRELLEDIIQRHRYPDFLGRIQIIMESLHQKINILLDSPQDRYRTRGLGAADVDPVERRIRNAAYELQDIIEQQIHSNSRDLESVEQQVHSIDGELEAIIGSRTREDVRLDDDDDFANTHPSESIEGNAPVGFEGPFKAIKDQLCSDSQQLQVIPIAGMAGIGKTTLARNIFEHALILSKFDFRGWVTVSQDYDVIRVLQDIRRSLEGEMLEEHGLEDPTVLLYKYLSHRKYLIVLDDVWNKQLWDDIKRYFPDDHKGSRILVTTTLTEVAKYASTSTFVHQMKLLNETESWNLFCKKVFEEMPCSPGLEQIGTSIASKCQGLPSAIVEIEKSISSDFSPQHWETIERGVSSNLIADGTHLSKVFFRSFNHFPHQLKACFLYMGSLPDEVGISISTLTQLWIAEGFLKSDDKSKTMEQVATECVIDLVQRNLVKISQKRANGDSKVCCIVHDLVRYFCRQRAFYEEFFYVDSENECLHTRIENARRINLCETSGESRLLDTGKLVRSILSFGNTFNLDIEWDKLILLRVLSVSQSWPIPNAIFQMIHLRYLWLYLEDLEMGACFSLSISVLHNLQTLIISYSDSYSITLPPEIWKITQLRHIIIGAMILPPIPIVNDTHFQKLELQTLLTVKNFIFTNEVIAIIPKLRKLKLSCMADQENGIWELYCLYLLKPACCLEELKIIVNGAPSSDVDSIFSNCVFSFSLKNLSLKGCKFSWNEMTVVGSLPNLQVLRLKENSFMGEDWDSIAGEFLKLKFLLLEGLNLKHWQVEYHHFPCLEHLKIKRCSELQSIPLEIGDIQALKRIDVSESPHAGASAEEILREQRENYGNEDLQVVVRD